MSHLCSSQQTSSVATDATSAAALTAEEQVWNENSPPTPAGLMTDRLRRFVFSRLERIHSGRLTLEEGDEVRHFGQSDSHAQSTHITIRDCRFYRRLVFGGSLSAADSFIKGEWDTPDLSRLLQLLARNAEAIRSFDRWGSRFLRPLRLAIHWMHRNTLQGSRRNIGAHYDLSNHFFSLMLDSTMTYSSGYFSSPEMTLADAQFEKYDRICRKLDIRPSDRVLEIGTGWGGFAEHAVRHYGCQVTTTTISEQQYGYAKKRFQKSGVHDSIVLLKQDYRHLKGQFDKLVSIEMIEAVGEKFLPGYFQQCSQLLKSDGAMCLQAITIPDHRFSSYRRSVDFIQRYIFPGGFLPSFGAITDSLGKVTDFRLVYSEDFAGHYATTLEHWRANFWRHIDQVRDMGFDQQWIRTWEYYLCYCIAGFLERQVGVSQIVLAKPLAGY